MLKVSNLHAKIGETTILTGLSLSIGEGEIHAVMGPNGSGKSTLAAVLAGSPAYEVTDGSVLLAGADLLEMSVEERAAAGLFLAFQYPPSIPGVSIAQFLRLARSAQQKARGETPIAFAPFIAELKSHMKKLELPWSFADRSVNDGFSGGEKKRLEMLQMLVLAPRLVILDEIDSGLDIDAMKLVAHAVHMLKEERPNTSFIIITHYQRLLTHIEPDHVHILKAGSIVKSGDKKLVEQLEREGYATLEP